MKRVLLTADNGAQVVVRGVAAEIVAVIAAAQTDIDRQQPGAVLIHLGDRRIAVELHSVVLATTRGDAAINEATSPAA